MLKDGKIDRIEEFIREETESLTDAEYVEWLEEVESRAAAALEAKREEMDSD